MSRRRLLALVAATSLVALAALPAAAAGSQPEPRHDGDGAVLNILPPGSNGTSTAADVLAFNATGARPANSVDQLATYDRLTRTEPVAITDAQLRDGSLFKDGSLGVAPADVVSTSTPRLGTTIQRDKAGVPHVTGVTDEDTYFGAGYAGTQDRMFLQDTLRHVGAARAAEFLGPSPANIAMDQSQLRGAAYTRAEAAAQIAALPARYGAEGTKLVRGLDAFVAGVNAAQRTMCPANLPTPAPSCPAEYAALQITPTDFEPADVTYTASLVGGIFGKGGGGEATNARWLQQLQAQFGATEGRRVFDDLRAADDPEAPTTSPTRTPYGSAGPYDPAASLLPDLGAASTGGTGTRTDPGAGLPVLPPPTPTLPGAAGSDTAATHIDGPFGRIDLSARPKGMSNALLVDAAHSTTGHPLAVFGPQTGYFAPQLLVEADLRGPTIAARGVSFAGTNAVIQLGHGVDYAWSATSAGGDLVDMVAERLCNTSGTGPVTTSSDGYLVDGACRPIEVYTHTELAKPSAGGTGAPAQLQFRVERSRHGIVQTRTTAGGAPVALTLQRSTYGGEFDSAIGFERINDPTYVHSVADFRRAFAGVDYTFNWFYADNRDIGYYHSGLLPLRPTSVDPALPRDGSRTDLDWQGFLAATAQPQTTNPPAGDIVSWNNKQAPGFRANDAQWGYGPVYRSLSLSQRLDALYARGDGKVTRADAVGVMSGAATVDARAAQLLPLVLDVLSSGAASGSPPPSDLGPAIGILHGWLADGAARADRDRAGSYSDAAAIALFDTWWESQTTTPVGAIALPRAVMRGGLGSLVDQLPKKVDDHPRLGLGSSWNDVSWYGYVSKDLRRVLGRPVAGAYSRGFCGGGSLTRCRADLTASLRAAIAEVARVQGTNDATHFTYNKHQDDIRSSAVGVVGVPAIDWQNRPTFQQVIDFRTSRPRVDGPTAVVPETPYAALLLVPALVVGGVLLLRRRRPGAASAGSSF